MARWAIGPTYCEADARLRRSRRHAKHAGCARKPAVASREQLNFGLSPPGTTGLFLFLQGIVVKSGVVTLCELKRSAGFRSLLTGGSYAGIRCYRFGHRLRSGCEALPWATFEICRPGG